MEQRKSTLISKIEKIVKKLKKVKLKIKHDEGLVALLEELSLFLSCTKMQAALFATVFKLSVESASISINDIASELNCSPLKVLEKFDDFDFLRKKRLIVAQTQNNYHNSFNYQEYLIPSHIAEGIGKMDQKYIFQSDKLELIPLLDRVYKIIQDKDDGNINKYELKEEVQALLHSNKHLKFVKKMLGWELLHEELLAYLFICRETVIDDYEVSLHYMCTKIWDDDSTTQFEIKKAFVKGKSTLMKKDLLKMQEGTFKNENEVLLTDKSINLLLEDDADLLLKKENVKGLIKKSELKNNNLFFNIHEQNQINELTSILHDKNFRKVQQRLAGNNMQTGVAVLFHGSAGTGKTAIVSVIAAETGRDIMMVDISDTKSAWFGESEKIIKKVFSDYRTLLKKDTLCPILMFNEADAVFGKRKDIGQSGVGQTENAIQNIILQELEDFEGILIATTNMTQNFDKAFQRRFLYKILFNKPDEATRAKILKDKIPGLSQQQAGILAKKYKISGGNVENVSRKITMKSILHGEKLNLGEIETYCQQESFGYEKNKPIGF